MKIDAGKLVALLIWKAVRWFILNMPDRLLASVFRGLRRLAWVVTGDDQLRSVITEVVEIFEDGPKYTDTVRMMLREADPDYSSDVLRGALKI